jgi:hypothetical protein
LINAAQQKTLSVLGMIESPSSEPGAQILETDR